MSTRISFLILFIFSVSCSGNKGKQYSSLDDAATDRIGVLLGSTQASYITEKYPNAEIISIDMASDLIWALKAGSCDVAIFTTIEAAELLKVNSELTVLQNDVYTTPLGAGFNKGNLALRDEFNLFLAEIKSNGLYDEIVARWTEDNGNAKMPEIVLSKTGKPIRVGTTSISIPYSFDKNGKLSGLDIELITRFAAHAKRPVEFQRMNFEALFPALSSGNVDVIINSIMITPERAKEIDFSDVYFESESTAIVMKKDKAPSTGYRSINEMGDKRIGVMLGSTQDAYVTQKFPKATIVRVNTTTDLKLALKGNKCDVTVMDSLIAHILYKNEPNICVLDREVFKGKVALGFSLKNTALRDEFNKMLAEFRNDGTYDQIYDRWINQPHPVMPVLDIPTTGAPLRVAVSSATPPFDYYENGENVGLDSELVRRFAQRLGRPIQFQIINFGGLIAALSSGKVDIIASGLSYTAERAKNVAFADAHYAAKAVSVILHKNLATTAKSISKRYATKEDLSTKRIAVLMGSTHDAYITKNFPKAEIVRCDSYTDVTVELTSGKCEAAVFSPSVYSSIKKSNPQVEILDSSLFQESSGIGFSYNQNTLKEQYNVFLKEIRANKLYDEMYERWINNSDNAEMPDIKMSTSGKPIRAAVSGTMVPFTFIRNGEHVGFDIEILLRFAQSVNRPIEFSAINFGELISALNSGKVDIIASFLAITPERARMVNFSDVYLVQDCVMAVLSEDMANTMQTVEKQGFFASIGDSFYNNLIAEKRYMLILKGLWQTLIISLFAALLGTILGAMICFMRMSKKLILNSFSKGYITIMRGIPVLVLLMLLYYAVFAKWDISATIVAILTFALNFAAYVSEMFRTSIQGVDRGQNEAGIAMGFTKVQTFIFVIMPQAIKSVLPVYKGELISLVKMTSVVGYIAVEDLTKASDIIRSRTFDAFFPLVMVAVIYFLLAWGFTALLESINKKMTTR